MRLDVPLKVAALAVCVLGLACSPGHAQTARKYGALAIDRSNGFFFGFAVDYDSPAEAEKRAVEEGNKRGGDTAVVLLWSGQGCGAYRSMNPDAGQGDAYGWGVAGTRFEAEAIASREANRRSNGKPTPNNAWACNSKSTAPLEILKDELDEPGGRDMILQHGGAILGVAFSPDGGLLATIASGENRVRLYDPKTGKILRTLEAPGVHYLAFSPGGKLATVAFEQIIIWDPKTGAQLGRHDDEDEVFSHPRFLSDGALAVEGAHDTYDPGGGHVTSFFDGATAGLLRKVVKNEPDMHGHGAAAFSPDGRRLAISAKSVEIWDTGSGKLVQALGAMESAIDLGYSADGRFLAVTGAGIELYDAQSYTRVRGFGGGTDISYSPVFSADGARLVTAHRDGSVRVWETASGREVLKFEGHADKAFYAALSPDGRMIASGAQDSTVRLWDVQTGKPIKAPPVVAPRATAPSRPTSPARASSPGLPDASRQAADRKAEADRLAAERERAAQADQAAADRLNQQILARDNEIKAANEKAAAEAAARQEAFRKAMADYDAAKAKNDAEVAAAQAARRKFEADKAAADAAQARYEADKAAADAAQARYEAELRAYQQGRGIIPKP